MSWSGREIRSTIDKNGELVLSLEQIELTEPGDDEVIVRIEATPVNPSDSGMLLGPADLSDIREFDSRVTMTVPSERLAAIAGRLGQRMPVGNEGAGTVVAAGKNAQAFMDKRVGMYGGGMYADYRRIDMHNLIVLPEGVDAADGASIFINPLTALGFVETAFREGHKALVHTAAASNLGQMLQRICLADGVSLINIVRSAEQEKILRELGATYVLNSKEPDFVARLTDAIEETGATIAFDAIGGGKLGIEIMNAMERTATRKPTAYSRYGSTLFKQLYIYGGLDSAPTILDRSGLGYAWSISGWLLFNYLNTVSPAVLQRLRQRIVDELTTTFASHYTRTIGLAELLDPDVLRALERKATGEKFLIDPRVG